MVSLKEMVADDRQVRFTHYKNGELWYVTETGFAFPVPITNTAEIGDASFLAEDKAMLFMRYIRRHIALLEQARAAQSRNEKGSANSS